MRPRVFPAEDRGAPSTGAPGTAASMRPRVFPAEDKRSWERCRSFSKGFNEAAGIPRGRRTWRRCLRRGVVGFNEAAGIPRGRHHVYVVAHTDRGASMRPRVFPAEDAEADAVLEAAARRFNEAAGIPRGRRLLCRCPCLATSGFNEAAGIPRGRRAARRSASRLASQLQ